MRRNIAQRHLARNGTIGFHQKLSAATTRAATEISKRWRESLAAGGGLQSGKTDMITSDDLRKGVAFMGAVIGAVLIIGSAYATTF